MKTLTLKVANYQKRALKTYFTKIEVKRFSVKGWLYGKIRKIVNNNVQRSPIKNIQNKNQNDK